MKKLVLIAALAAFVGCDEKEPEVVEIQAQSADSGVAPADAAGGSDATKGDEAPDGDLDPYKGTTIYGSPHDEEHMEIEIRFNGQQGDVLTLYRNPGTTTSESGKLKPEPGEKLEAVESLVIVQESRPIVAEKNTRFPATDYFPTSNKFGKDRLVEVKKGEVVRLLKHAAEGTCFIGFDTQTFHAPCPSTDAFDWDGERTNDGISWWVLVTDAGARGWLEVDNQMVRHKMVKAKK